MTENNSFIEKVSKPLFNICLALGAIAALGNLALSQLHIAVIVKIFATNIGFYFFLYIIFGLVTLMNGLNIKKPTNNLGNKILLIGCATIATVVGIKYISLLLADIKLGNLLTMADISLTLYITIGSVIIYSVGSVLIIVTEKAAKRGM